MESNNTPSSTSILTSSDKLTALPQHPTQHISALASRSSASNLKRGWRRSLDASTSLPFVAASDHGIWATPRRTELNQNSPEGSIGKETPRQRVSFDSDRNSPTMHHVNSGQLLFQRINVNVNVNSTFVYQAVIDLTRCRPRLQCVPRRCMNLQRRGTIISISVHLLSLGHAPLLPCGYFTSGPLLYTVGTQQRTLLFLLIHSNSNPGFLFVFPVVLDTEILK